MVLFARKTNHFCRLSRITGNLERVPGARPAEAPGLKLGAELPRLFLGVHVHGQREAVEQRQKYATLGVGLAVLAAHEDAAPDSKWHRGEKPFYYSTF